MRISNLITLAALALTGGLLWASPANASVIIGTSNSIGSPHYDWSSFENDGPGDTGESMTDSTTSITFTLTTQALGGAGASDLEETSSGYLGVNSDLGGRFNPGDSWAFDTEDTGLYVLRVTFNAAGSNGNGLNGADEATLQSNAWIGAVITPGSSFVSFNSATGTFTLDNGESNDNFDTEDMWGVGATTGVGINPGSDIVFSHLSDTGGDGWRIGGLELGTFVVPEPASLTLLGLGSLLIAGRRRFC